MPVLCGAFRNACICLIVKSLQGGASLALDFFIGVSCVILLHIPFLAISQL